MNHLKYLIRYGFIIIYCFFAIDAKAQVIDFHTHIEGPGLAAFLGSNEITGNDLINTMNKVGVERAIVLSSAYVFYYMQGDSRSLVEAENDFVWTESQKFPNRLIPFCSAPLNTNWYLEEFRRCKQKGFKGIKLHLMNHNLNLDDPLISEQYGEIVDLAEELRMIVLIHPKITNEEGFFNLIFQSMRTSMPVVIAHALTPNWKYFIQLSLIDEAYKPQNIYTDLSALLNIYQGAPPSLREEILWSLRHLGTKNILFGSDWHPYSMQKARDGIESFTSKISSEYGFSESEVEQILYHNAASILSGITFKLPRKSYTCNIH